MSMGQEIERKYLLAKVPTELIREGVLRVVSRKVIEQTYLAFSNQEEVRVRKLISDGEVGFTHTYKRGNGLLREEIEYEIGPDIYEQLLTGSSRKPLVKTRITVEADGYEIDIDEYAQFDLCVAEVEFPDVEAANRFQPPAWFGQELGSEEEYRNKTLWITVQNGGTA
jgi:CYTH domain-containing protein